MAAPLPAPNVQAHLSPFSSPSASYHPSPVGSVIVSLCSWLATLSVASAGLPFGRLPVSQPETAAYGWFAYSVVDEPLPNQLW